MSMPFLKTIDGHNSVTPLRRYLERGGRVRASAFLNIGDEEHWDKDMDAVLRSFGHHRKRGGRGRTRFYEHFVVSPNPADAASCDAEKVMALALEWARDRFPDHQCAILLHDDTERAGYHAHVAVCASNLETGLKLQMSDRDQRQQAKRLQEIARGLGFTTLPDLPVARIEQKDAVRSAERGMASRGARSWVQEVRDAVRVAAIGTEDFAGLRANLESMGFGMRLTKRGITYLHADGTHEVRDKRLGAAYYREDIEAAFASRSYPDFASEIEAKGPLSGMSAEVLARCLYTIRQERIEAFEGFDPLINMVEGDAAEVRRELSELARALGGREPVEVQAERIGRQEKAMDDLERVAARLDNLVVSRHVAREVLNEAEDARADLVRGEPIPSKSEAAL